MDTGLVLLDSSILIDYFRKGDKTKSVLYKISEKYYFCLSAITVFEIKIGIKTDKQLNDYNTLIKNMQVMDIDEKCIDIAVNIYKNLKIKNSIIELADLLIAATAISNTIPLVTFNRKHFQNVSDLEIINFKQ